MLTRREPSRLRSVAHITATQVLGAFSRKHRTLTELPEALQGICKRLKGCHDVSRLRGLEGLGARHYYAGLRAPPAAYEFSGRNRRPPRDPINAALSYGYALLARVLVAVQAAALHPEVGFLHAESRRNPALVLDLIKEFRIPVVDPTVFRAFLRGTFEPLAHFYDQQGGLYLSDAGKNSSCRLPRDFFTRLFSLRKPVSVDLSHT